MVRALTLIDDMDGTVDAETREFTIGGTDYSIDLSDENYRKMLRAIEPWRCRARTRQQRRNNSARVLSADDRQKIRKWAESNNFYIAPRGRFPSQLVKKYYAEQGITLVP